MNPWFRTMSYAPLEGFLWTNLRHGPPQSLQAVQNQFQLDLCEGRARKLLCGRAQGFTGVLLSEPCDAITS